jgi:hypothetical protein
VAAPLLIYKSVKENPHIYVPIFHVSQPHRGSLARLVLGDLGVVPLNIYQVRGLQNACLVGTGLAVA